MPFNYTALRSQYVALRLVVDQSRVLPVGLGLAGTRRVLQLGDHIGRPHVFFAAHAIGVFATGVEHRRQYRVCLLFTSRCV